MILGLSEISEKPTGGLDDDKKDADIVSTLDVNQELLIISETQIYNAITCGATNNNVEMATGVKYKQGMSKASQGGTFKVYPFNWGVFSTLTLLFCLPIRKKLYHL